MNNKDFYEKYFSDMFLDCSYSDCCGAETIETDMGICPNCLEHCEFITEEHE